MYKVTFWYIHVTIVAMETHWVTFVLLSYLCHWFHWHNPSGHTMALGST